MTRATSSPNGEISALWRPERARLELTVQPAPAHAGSGLDLFEELNGDVDHVKVPEAWHHHM